MDNKTNTDLLVDALIGAALQGAERALPRLADIEAAARRLVASRLYAVDEGTTAVLTDHLDALADALGMGRK